METITLSNNAKSNIRRFPGALSGLVFLLHQIPNNSKGIELGCYMGESTEVFAVSRKFIELHCVDAWKAEHLSTIAKEDEYMQAEAEFDKVAAKYPVIQKHKMLTIEYLPNAPMVDFVYVDALHTYEAVYTDIQLSIPKIRAGGILAGHDYSKEHPGVVQAVHEIIGRPDGYFIDTSWFKVLGGN